MKMKKFIAVLSVATMAAGLAVGCGSSDSGSSDDKSSKGDWDSSNDITIVSREDGSGTRGAFIELFGIEEKKDGEKVDMTTDDAQITNSTSVMLTTVAGDDYAIGYVSLGSLNDTVKALKIDGEEATELSGVSFADQSCAITSQNTRFRCSFRIQNRLARFRCPHGGLYHFTAISIFSIIFFDSFTSRPVLPGPESIALSWLNECIPTWYPLFFIRSTILGCFRADPATMKNAAGICSFSRKSSNIFVYTVSGPSSNVRYKTFSSRDALCLLLKIQRYFSKYVGITL